MRRFVFTACVMVAALAGCDRDPPLQDKPAQAPIAVATVPSADGSAVRPPSVPADIVNAPPSRPRVAPKPVKPPEGGAYDDHSGDARDGQRGDDAFDPDASDARDEAPSRSLTVHWEGIGNIEFGMDVDEVRDAWPGDLGDQGTAEQDECLYLSQSPRRPADAPALMFERGRFVRYDIDTPATDAPGGGGVGMHTLEILDRYGGSNVERSPHKYTDGEYLRVESPEGGSVLLFETDEEGVVTEWRMGVEPQVDYVEGCS